MREAVRVGLGMALLSALTLAGCAGRDPEPIQTVQPWDAQASCTQVRAEIDANNIKIKSLADEQGLKVAQNIVTGVGGLFTLGIAWAGMDFKGAASKDVAALQARQQYLAVLASERCAPQAAPPAQRRAGAHPTHASAVQASASATPPAQRLPPEAYYQPPPPATAPATPDQGPAN